MSEFERFEDDDNELFGLVNKWKPIILSNLRFLIISGISIMLLAVLYLITTTKEYNTIAKIQILDKDETSAFVLEDMINIDSPLKDREGLENEIEVLKSKNILETVIEALSLNHQFSTNSLLSSTTLKYSEIPFTVYITESNKQQEFIITADSDKQFTITNSNAVTVKFNFGKRFVLENDTITINKSKHFHSDIINNEFSLLILNKFNVFLSLKKQIEISLITDDILEILVKGGDAELNSNIIKSLLSAYRNDGLTDNKMVSESTATFLTDRINLINIEISILETTLSNIKKGNDIFDITTINSIFSNQKVASKEMSFGIETQEILANSFLKKLKGHNFSNLLPLPIEIGIENSELANFTNKFNALILERNKLLKGRTNENPEIQLLNSQLNDLYNNLNNSITNYLDNLVLKKNKITDYDNDLESEFFQLNDTELSIVRLRRDLEVKANILVFLLQKQEENSLKLAINSPTFKVLDPTYTDTNSSSPNSKKVLITSFFLALLLPFLFVATRLALYNKLTDKASLKRVLNKDIPILGEIPFCNEQIIQPKSRGVLIESFRLIRTNLNYLLINNKSKTILVTSSILKEGKTFTSINLAQSLSSVNNNRVIVIGLDLRNPQIHKFLQINKDTNTGVTNYLLNNEQDINSLIHQHESVDFDFILSGPIPPNPAELLLTERLNNIIEFAKKNYDYVILDTAPCVLVSDTLNLFKYADATIYLTKSKYTELKLVDYINQLKEGNLINNPAIVLNGLENNPKSYGYNYGYGYGYGSES